MKKKLHNRCNRLEGLEGLERFYYYSLYINFLILYIKKWYTNPPYPPATLGDNNFALPATLHYAPEPSSGVKYDV